MNKKDYYEILGVPRDASSSELKKAYRRLAVQHHPDRNPGNKKSEESFKEAAEAYSVLSDANQRAKYDRFGHSAMGGASGGFNPDAFADFGDILGDMFGFGDLFGGRQRQGNRPRRGQDLRYDLELDFEEAVVGINTKIKIPRQDTCSECSGSGAAAGSGQATCGQCGGNGQARYQQGFFTISRTCSTCQGTGKVIKHPCNACRGIGRVPKEKTLELSIPAGIDHGQQLRVTGEGEAGNRGGPRGDLYVVVSVREHPFFKRQDQHIYCEIPLSFSQAALGAEVDVPTLSGKEKIRIPEGTQTGTTFRLRNHGIPRIGEGGKGDQFIKVNVVTPAHLTEDQKTLFRNLAEISGDEIHERGTLFEKVKEMFG